MTSSLEAVVFEVSDGPAVAAFWASLLGREVWPEAGGGLLPGDQTQVGLRFVTSTGVQVGPRHLHLHLTSEGPEHQHHIVATALRLGASHLDVGQGEQSPFVVLADPGGNELCVIEPGNRFLAGTGALGEVTCDGSRRVGMFWRDALGWPLVWDHGDQTAIQSPLGGTKISWDAWGRSETAPTVHRRRQRFDLRTADLDQEVARLLLLGATVGRRGADGIELADPDGSLFRLRRV